VQNLEGYSSANSSTCLASAIYQLGSFTRLAQATWTAVVSIRWLLLVRALSTSSSEANYEWKRESSSAVGVGGIAFFSRRTRGCGYADKGPAILLVSKFARGIRMNQTWIQSNPSGTSLVFTWWMFWSGFLWATFDFPLPFAGCTRGGEEVKAGGFCFVAG
jgi:hypothetical protein